MWIERLEIEGFRSLSGSYEFAEGLTIVVGDNEAGKSSLHDALVRTLFGFSKTDRRRSRGSSPLERRAPWTGSPYRLIGFVRKDTRQFRIEWDFSVHRVRLLDQLGSDISDSVLAKGDEVELGEYLLGIGVDDFRQVCCIDQEGLLAVRQSPSLGVALQAAVANVAGETPVAVALASLDNFLRTVVGARVDNLNPSPTGRLAALGRQADELRAQLQAAEKAREGLVEISREIAKEREKQNALLAEHERSKQGQLLAELERLTEHLAEAQRQEVVASDRPEVREKLDADRVDAIKAARDALLELDGQIGPAKDEADAVAESVSRLEKARRELTASVDGLSAYEGIDVSARDQIQATAAQLESLASQEKPKPGEAPTRDPLLERYRSERDSLHALIEHRAPSNVRRLLWVVLVILTLGLAWLIRMIVRRRRGVAPGSIAEWLAPYGGVSLADLDARAEEENHRIAVAEGIAAAFAESRRLEEDQRRNLVNQLEHALDGVDAPPGELDERIRAYLVAVERNTQRTEKEAALGRVQQELTQVRRPLENFERLKLDRSRAEQRLRNAYEALEINAEDITAAERAFEAALLRAEREDKGEQDADAAATALRSILSGDSMEILVGRVADAKRLFDAHRAAHGELFGGSTNDIDEREPDLEVPVREQVQLVTALETRAKQLEEEAGDPATLKEKLAAIESQVDRLDEAKAAVAIARDVLRESADELSREFAPHLNAALKRNLSRITNGRYADAIVNADLAVQVVVPETGKLESADELSRATKDQLFLVQRLEIARLLAPTKGNAPLLLDDPFAHYDHERIRRGLEIVAEAAEERQIVVFSENPGLVELTKDVCASCHVIELPRPLAKVGG